MPDDRRYLILDDVVDEASAEHLALLAETEDRWKLHEEWFFSQNDFTWVRRQFEKSPIGELLPPTAALVSVGKKLFENQFNSVIGNHFTVIGHKMVPGQIVGIHNDSPEQDRGRMENFRLVFYVDRNFEDSQGGHLILFGSRNNSDVLDAVRPVFNSAVLMQLSDTSFHGVNRIKQGTRYSIVVSYWGYPMLFNSPTDQTRVRALLSRMVDSGLEEVPHSGTTFAYHLYNTFRILHGWKQEVDVCLAGLAHSLLGRRHSGVASASISAEELRRILGERAYSIVQWLSFQDGFGESPGNDSWISNSGYLVELANLFEQAIDDRDLARVLEQSHVSFISPAIKKLIEADIVRVRATREMALPY
ncbi:MAG: 2OG-Fe(II) oxygenase [Nitrospira sp.]|nr:2OG-Fe(II) oxygenase [Nitrospira sp.]